MISRMDENAPKCIYIHGRHHKKRIQIPRPFFYGHFRPLLAQKWPFFSITSIWKKENYSKWYPEWSKRHPNVYLQMVFNIKRIQIPRPFFIGHFRPLLAQKWPFFRITIIWKKGNNSELYQEWMKMHSNIYLQMIFNVKKRIQILRPFAQKWNFFSIISFWKKEYYSKWYQEWIKMPRNVYLCIIQHKNDSDL